MIATILQSTPTFHAVAYNEYKVQQGVATLLEIKNFSNKIHAFGYSDAKQLQDYLISYSKRNSRIKNPQFHLAISCKGHEYTHQQLLDFAHSYLEEMGYGDPNQPLLIYAHNDTDNTHIHIVTSRVAPNGKKIDHNKERIRSQKTIEKLTKQNIKLKAEKDVKDAMMFDFSDIRQFKSVMEAMKYECFETKGENGDICIKKGGMVLVRIPKSQVLEQCRKNNFNRMPDAAERMKWKSIFKKYRDLNSDRAGLEKDLRSMFGISLVWMGSKDNPFGYQVVDFNKKKVYDGYRILHIKDLCQFMSKEEHINNIQLLIDQCLNENPYMTSKQLNKRLNKLGGYVKKDYFVFGNDKIPLERNIADTLQRNNKIAWRQSFHPASTAERDVLCQFTSYDHPELINIEQQPESSYKPEEVSKLYVILSIRDEESKKKAFDDAGYKMLNKDGKYYAINLGTNTILDMERTGLPRIFYAPLIPKADESVGRTQPRKSMQQNIRQKSSRIPSVRELPSGHQNREWEVGKKGRDRDDMDDYQGLQYS